MEMSSKIPAMRLKARSAAPGLVVEFTGTEETPHSHLSGKPFALSIRKKV